MFLVTQPDSIRVIPYFAVDDICVKPFYRDFFAPFKPFFFIINNINIVFNLQ